MTSELPIPGMHCWLGARKILLQGNTRPSHMLVSESRATTPLISDFFLLSVGFVGQLCLLEVEHVCLFKMQWVATYSVPLVKSEQALRLKKWTKYKTSKEFIELTANLEKLSYHVSWDSSEVTDLNNQAWPFEEFLGVLIALTREQVNKSKH